MASLWFESALLAQGWASRVRITDVEGCIARIETGVDPAQGDERHAIALPGLPNLHSHAFQRGLAGLTERRGPGEDGFWSWRELMYRFLERLDPDELEALAALAFMEMLETGFTRVGEFHYLHHDTGGVPFADPGEMAGRIAAAAAATGIGLTLLPVFYAHSGFGAAAPDIRQRRFVCDMERYSRVLESAARSVAGIPGARLGVAPHSLRAVSAEELAAVIGLGRGLPKHIHIAEQAREVQECVAWCGLTPIAWLMSNAAVDEHWCLVHATHATDEELARIGACGAVVGLCPVTEANLGDGIFPAPELLRQGGRFGIGTDSNVRIDAAEELRTLEYSQRLRRQGRNVLAPGAADSTGRNLFSSAVSAGSQALGFAAGLARGAPLDALSLRSDHIALVARTGDEILDSWIFCGDRGVVEDVWCSGHKIVINGHHVGRAGITARYRRVLKGLLAERAVTQTGTGEADLV